MQSRRTPAVSPLAIVVPHPPLPRRRSSLLSANSAPRTPRSCASPTCSSIFFTPSRKSTDSWNSSNADEIEWEWKPDQVLLLQRTLDALPAHLVTPFNGPIPPSNLLDKIARGVSQAKGPVDWPHSIRATRVKLIELSRLKAKEETVAEQRRRVIAEEPEIEMEQDNYSYIHDGDDRPIGLGAVRRPLYRQSSMDFIEPAGTDIKHNDNIARLSRRLQRSDRVFATPAYHPYTRSARAQVRNRSSSPPPLKNVPSLISPSTQSSDTINTLSSFSSGPHVIRRTTSSNLSSAMSVFSDSSSGSLPDPRLQRIRRSETMSAGSTGPTGLKRAPSYGTPAQVARHGSTRHARHESGSYPSSDEEEKLRTKHAKKQRTKSPTSPPSKDATPLPSAFKPSSRPPSVNRAESPKPPPVPEKDPQYLKARKTKSPIQDENVQASQPTKVKKTSKIEGSKGLAKEKSKSSSEKRPLPMNAQRNPSMFGPELPQAPTRSKIAIPTSPILARAAKFMSPIKTQPSSPASPALAQSPSVVATPPQSPSPQTKTLRRVRRLAPARRISFGSLAATDEGPSKSGGSPDQPARTCLGSAFQLL